MRAPSLPANETQRVQALLDTGLLDSPAEERFDRLTKLAQQVLHVPIALITLVDAQRQWFKSCQGIDVTETARDISFCAHTILEDGILEVADAQTDVRFADNPLVVGAPYIRFYAGAPLRTPEGWPIGTLCIISDTPRQLTASEHSILQGLADCVEAEIQKIDLLRQLQALDMSQKLQDVISLAQSQFIQEDAQRTAFDSLLQGLLELTRSEYGFIGEVCHRANGAPYLKTYALTNIAWDAATHAFYTAHAPQGMEFTNLDSLFGAALRTGEPVISNTPAHDPRRGGLPAGHPALHAFLGVPVFHGGEMLAMFGMANRPGGYHEKLLTYLQPLTVAIGQLVSAQRLRRLHQQTQAELSRLSRVASETTNAVVITNTAGHVQWINAGFTRMTGYALEEVLGHTPGAVLQGPQSDPTVIATMRAALARSEGFEVCLVNYTKDRRPYWIRISCTPLRSSEGTLQGFMAIQSDITAQRQSEQELRQFKNTLDQTLDCVFMFDAQTLQFFYANVGALQHIGYAQEALFAMHPYDIKPAYPEVQFRAMLAPLIAGTQAALTFDTVHRHQQGHLIPVEIFLQYVHPEQERPHFVAIVRDITERKQNQDRLQYLATHDALTGLPNRSLFMERLQQEIERAQREHHLIGVLLLDLDNFKVVNDSFGHHQGDTLLVELARRLSGALCEGDTVARLGGDEYAVMLRDVGDEADILQTARRLLQAVSEPVWVQAQEFTPTISIGCSVFPQDAHDGATLLRHADAAMYAAKGAGRSTVIAYRDEMEAMSNEHIHILARLQTAISKNALQLFYQPQVDTCSGRIIGAEALLRWDDAELGSVSPARFIPVAEASGLILPLGDWVLDTACQQIAAWHARGWTVPIAINLSVYQFRQTDLVHKIQTACQRHHCPPHLLELEITESAAMQSPELAHQQITALTQAGFSLALDDFGTGYSSLARLGKLRVHKLKIDRSFIVEVPGHPMYEALVRSTISMGTEMGMQLIAEGVETEAQRAFLELHGCQAYQGWLFSKAMPAADFLTQLQQVNAPESVEH